MGYHFFLFAVFVLAFLILLLAMSLLSMAVIKGHDIIIERRYGKWRVVKVGNLLSSKFLE